MPPTPSRDPQWLVDAVKRLQGGGGDPSDLFRPIFDHYEPVFRRYFRRRGIPPDLAEDLAQDTIVRVYKGIDNFAWQSSFNTWTLRIVTNAFIKHLESLDTARGRAWHDPIEDEVGGAEDDARRAKPLVDQAPDPHAAAAYAELKAELRAAIEALPARMRQCVLLRFQGFSYREIARMMSVSAETVKKQLADGRRRLRGGFEMSLGLVMVVLGELTSWMGG